MVIRAGNGQKAVQDSLQGFRLDLNTECIREYPGGRGEVSWTVGRAAQVVYGHVPAAATRYVQVVGDDEEEVLSLVEHLEQQLHPWGYEDLLLYCDEAHLPNDRASAVVRLAIGAPPAFDEDFFSRIRDALCDSDATVRDAGIQAASHYAVTQFAPLLDELARTDPDPELRETAQALLSVYEKAGLTQ
ncbi:hypothetical protein ACR820_01660 [Streptomyces netropsis]